MKNFTSILFLLIVVSASLSAQQEKGIIGTQNWLSGWTDFAPSRANYEENYQVISGNITDDITLYKKHTYLLKGNVFVTNNAILSIEPGTVIMGDSKSKATLTITPGAAIIAEGTSSDPIVFTSNAKRKKAGDWGGIIILGDSYSSKLSKTYIASLYSNLDPASYEYTKFGGDNLKSNSGFISYVRIEYAGGSPKNSNVFSGLLLVGVGVSTSVNNVMVSYSEGNSICVVGGEIQLNQMVSNKPKGNDYDFRYGADCDINNSVAVRSPYLSLSGSRCMNVLSDTSTNTVVDAKNETTVRAKNMTLLTDSEDINSDIKVGLIKESVFIGEGTHFSLENSVVSGFNKAILLSEDIKINDVNLSKINLKNICFNKCKGAVSFNLSENRADLENWFKSSSFNDYTETNHSELFIDLSSNHSRDYRLNSSEAIAMNTISESTEN